MKNLLVVQTLGNNDVLVKENEEKKGSDYIEGLNCKNEKELENNRKLIEEFYQEQVININFPLIKILNESLKKRDDYEITFCIILTNQRQWLYEKCPDDSNMWKKFSTSDGKIWKNILEDWCKNNNIKNIILDLSISGKVTLGVSDWENTAPLVVDLLNENLVSKSGNLFNKYYNRKIDKLLIQHNSGTPALCSALYLWGIEQKLAGKDVEFAYISKESEYRAQEPCHIHNGSHWQWRLLIPQINELLELQDFSGAKNLISETAFENSPQIRKELEKLDKLSSFNLIDIKNSLSSINEQSIERIAIALWSEKGFRQRGQWMHWMLRVTGAFELACYQYLAEQEEWYWHRQKLGISIWHRQIPEDTRFYIPIADIIKILLTKGEYEYLEKDKDLSVKLTCPSISDARWNDFRNFYINDRKGWKIDDRRMIPFSYIRNQIYHTLMGDSLDELLDAKTVSLGGVFHSEHPSQVAVKKLHEVLEMTGLKDRVLERIEEYKERVKNIKEDLLK